MPDITYKYVGTAQAIYGDPVIVYDSWPQLSKDAWTKALLSSGYAPQSPPWVPVYDTATVNYPGVDASGNLIIVAINLNPLEFPSKATVDHLGQLYGGITVEFPFFANPNGSSSGGPDYSNAVRRVLVFNNTVSGSPVVIDAYQLANYYTNNPPFTADRECKLFLQSAGVKI